MTNLGNTDAITYDGAEVDKLTLDGTTIWEKPTSALPATFIAAQQACDPTADLDGYLYDDNHYLIRYLSIVILGSYAARGQVYEFYCYGSDDSFVTPPTFTPFYPLEAKTLNLFDTTICVGWASWQFGAQMGGAEMQALSLVASTTHNAILNHTLDVSGGGSSTAVSTKNYRQYIHPENCSVLGQTDPYYANSAASNSELLENNGGLNSHIEALELVDSNSAHISIYPIKKA